MSESLNKITYLLGAGASASPNGIPLVKDFSTSLRKLANTFVDSSEYKNRELLQSVRNDILWLAEQGDKHLSIDSFAKFCYNKKFNNDDFANFLRIKRTLAHYFFITQIINGNRDSRYLNWLNRLIVGQNPFPYNIKILNWNYDIQPQLASYEYKPEVLRGNTFHTPSLIHYYPNIGAYGNANIDKIQNDNFEMIHLNGIAGYYFDWNNNLIIHHNLGNTVKDIDEYFSRIQEKPLESLFNTLSFAFEDNTDNDYIFLKDKKKHIQELLTGTDYLVIIGYSFPFYNAGMDNFIFDILKKGNLKKIYVQNPTPNFPANRLNMNMGTGIEYIEDCSIFYIPEETFQKRNPSLDYKIGSLPINN